MTTRVGIALVVLVLGAAGCGSDGEPEAEPTPSTSSASPSPAPSASEPAAPPTRTPELDVVGAIGHSGLTGYNSDGGGTDAEENSWATGTNPAVDSIYLRLLAAHPELEGNNPNLAIDGSDVGSLMGQAESLLEHDPLPDLVLIQSIDNDIRCDGSDPDNYGPFEAELRRVVTFLEENDPGVHLFFVDQWTSVAGYNAVKETIERRDPGITGGDDDCGGFVDGKRVPRLERGLQRIVDSYYARIEKVCRAARSCATDGAALQRLALTPRDLTTDYNHLSVSGHAKMAEIVWRQLPRAWK